MHHYTANYLGPGARAQLMRYLCDLRPIWEMRYPLDRPPPEGQTQRRLLRPVYWLGNWQFACLDYYHPPKGIFDRCVSAEPFAPILEKMRLDIERRARAILPPNEIPKGWHLNTCLVNYYGERQEGEKWVDAARVGEHRDFEPGPVASVSLGAKALIQFVASKKIGEREPPHTQQWLDDGSLQLFAGTLYKDRLFHRVQRVARTSETIGPEIAGFRTRRINLTLRYVPPSHVVALEKLSRRAQLDVLPYVRQLAQNSPFFAQALARVEAPA